MKTPLTLLGLIALSLPVSAQYSAPIRDVSDPGRAPFQVFTQSTLDSAQATPLVIASVPAGASQRLVVDFANIQAQGNSTIPRFVFIRINGSTSVPDFQISFPLTPIPPAPGQQVSIGIQSMRFYVSAGQTLSVISLNLGSDSLLLSAAFTGHYVTLP